MSEEQKQLPPGPAPQAKEIEFSPEGVRLTSAEDAWRFAKRCFDSGMLPEQVNNANQAFVILCRGAELGIPPFASWTYIYLTKARRLALSTKGALAVVQSRPSYAGYREWIEGEGTPQMKACAWAQRKGFPAQTKEFTMADAEAAGLLKRKRSARSGEEYDGPWQAFLKDMLLARARGRVLDVVFQAELGGIPIEGPAEDADLMTARAHEAERPSLQERKQQYALPEREQRGLPAGAPSDPLLSLLEQQTDTPLLDPSLVEVIDQQVEEVFGPRDDAKSGPAPAAQPEPAKPAAAPEAHTAASAGPGEGGANPDAPFLRRVRRPSPLAGPAPFPKDVGTKPLVGGDPCPRCGVKLNELAGCDACGWPGEDMR